MSGTPPTARRRRGSCDATNDRHIDAHQVVGFASELEPLASWGSMRDSVQIDLNVAADDGYRHLCHVEHASRWGVGVAGIRVLERDDSARPVRVRFVAMPARGSVAYELAYAYEPAQWAVRWWTTADGPRQLRGRARFVPTGPGRCRMRYEIDSTLTGPLPAWARAVLAEESAASIAFAFRRWVEGAAPGDRS